jgi:DNA polymerase III alpha subunit
LLWQLDQLEKLEKSNKTSICAENIFDNFEKFSIPELPEYSDKEKLLNEISILDIAVSNHPLILYKDLRNVKGLISSVDMRKCINRKVKMIGWMVTNRRVYTVKGEYMKFLTLEDFDGIYEAVMFPKAYQKYGNLVVTRGPYIIIGKINNEYGYQTITVDEVELVSNKYLSSQEVIETSESEYL